MVREQTAGAQGLADLRGQRVAVMAADTALDEIARESKRSTGVTRQLLAFARRQTIAPKVLDLNDEVGNMLKMLRRLIGETILLVEDETSVRVTTGMFLDALGYSVMEAESPEEALRLAAEHPARIDLLITDVVMPGMSGRDLTERLAEEQPDLHTIYMSGYTPNDIAHRGILADDVHFLAKPFTRDALARELRKVLRG